MVTVGFISVGSSAFLMLAVASRLLGAELFSGVGLVWTVSSIYGIGLAGPVEQFINRNRNTGRSRGLRGPSRTLGGGAGLTVVLSLLIVGRNVDRGLEVAAIGIAAVGWWAVTLVRGRLAGAGDLRAYAWVLVCESSLRLILVVLAWVLPGSSRWLLFAAIGLPLLGAAFFGLRWRIPAEAKTENDAPAYEQVWFIAMSLGIQVCLNGAPILLQWQFTGVRIGVVGAFVAASTYFRIPTILVGGIQTRGLVELSHAAGGSDSELLRSRSLATLREVGAVTVIATIALGLLEPWLLPWYYGRRIGLPVAAMVGLGCSTILVAVAMAGSLTLLATSRAALAGRNWLAGAAVSASCYSVAGGQWGIVVLGLIAGPLVVVGLTARGWTRL